MDHPKHVLVGTDFSEASASAVEMAAVLATKFGAKLTLTHVFDPEPMVPPIVIPHPERMEHNIEQEYAKAVERELERTRDEKLADVKNVQLLALRDSHAAHAICEYAKKHDVDLIVIGTHGRSAIGKVLIGSVAERVVRHASCSVVTTRP